MMGMPRNGRELFLDLLLGWWNEKVLQMLAKMVDCVAFDEIYAKVQDIRDEFTAENLPSFELEPREGQMEALTAQFQEYRFVDQLRWIDFPTKSIQKAIVDYYQAVTHTDRWCTENLVAIDEISRYERRLVDEWERVFDRMCDGLPSEATEDDKRVVAKEMLWALLDRSELQIRARYEPDFYRRGTFHSLADSHRAGWHPDFKAKILDMLDQSA